MKKELQTMQIASFVLSKQYKHLREKDAAQLKRHLLDAVGSMLHAATKPAIGKLVKQITTLNQTENSFFNHLPPDRAAQLYTALIRYPDFMDNFMGKEATCHPSDNIGSLLAAARLQPITGKDFLLAMAIAYEIECRLVLEIPVMKEGIDHTLFLAFSIVAGVSKLLGLTKEQMANALGIAGASISPMVTSRASYTFEWKGFASSLQALNCMGITLLAQQGMTGPHALFEGPKGFDEIFGMKLQYDWSKDAFELIRRCVLKKYNAEVHAQSSIEAVMELRNENTIVADNIEKIDVATFLTAYHIIGSGAYGDRKNVKTKEQADHSLFYLIAVALLDGDIYPEQFEPDRIMRQDVQDLLQKVTVHTGFPLHKPVLVAGALDPYTQHYPDKMKTKVEIELTDGTVLKKEKEDYHGFFTRPFTWEDTIDKFIKLTRDTIEQETQQQFIELIQHLELNDNFQKLTELINLETTKQFQKMNWLGEPMLA